jgi:hypothetical protein
MLDNKSYGLIFNESNESIPKSIKGDYNGIHEIKISREKIYIPKNVKEQT